MILATFTLSSQTLHISKSLNELVQAAIYTHLPDAEHKGYGKENKNFKAMNFFAKQEKNRISIRFSAFNKEYEAAIAKAILLDTFKIGALHFARKTVEICEKRIEENQAILSGYVCVYIKDPQGKRLFLEPKDERFLKSLKNNALQKYEALLGEPYQGELDIQTLYQKKFPQFFLYGKAKNLSWYGKYEVKANPKMLNLLLDTGMGSKAMQGCGFVEVWKKNDARK
ncbi:MAG: CRISPR-associated endoribonuclease Cas6 [Wolinella succinogenes]|uniref:CRISPR-associated endoribonuclease Cas6 n=1 Tax=Wolinella succinogenes TaxID=844 RepID=UPI0016BB3B13|nr:CRISPR-associated endoribonuclease Cas6 [Wolinella succinogenes]NLU35390.1 CRISPR-associated endoribonuclease Cas6 [Wolinella succinogenes]